MVSTKYSSIPSTKNEPKSHYFHQNKVGLLVWCIFMIICVFCLYLLHSLSGKLCRNKSSIHDDSFDGSSTHDLLITAQSVSYHLPGNPSILKPKEEIMQKDDSKNEAKTDHFNDIPDKNDFNNKINNQISNDIINKISTPTSYKIQNNHDHKGDKPDAVEHANELFQTLAQDRAIHDLKLFGKIIDSSLNKKQSDNEFENSQEKQFNFKTKLVELDENQTKAKSEPQNLENPNIGSKYVEKTKKISTALTYKNLYNKLNKTNAISVYGDAEPSNKRNTVPMYFNPHDKRIQANTIRSDYDAPEPLYNLNKVPMYYNPHDKRINSTESNEGNSNSLSKNNHASHIMSDIDHSQIIDKIRKKIRMNIKNFNNLKFNEYTDYDKKSKDKNKIEKINDKKNEDQSQVDKSEIKNKPLEQRSDTTYEGLADFGTCSLRTQDEDKFDCYPRGIPDEKSCTERGCCWQISSNYKVPACYYPVGFETYRIVQIVNLTYGFDVIWKNKIKSPYGQDIDMIQMSVKFETKERVHIKIIDANATRYEPIIPEIPVFGGHISWSVESLYEVSVAENKTGFAVVRKSDKSIIFDSRNVGGFIYSNQFIQISSLLSSKYIYGLGEHRNDFLLDTDWKTITLWALDNSPTNNVNGYGSHPFYLNLNNETGNAHGVYLKSSNAMDIILQPTPAITYRVIGGILDFYFFLGPSPGEVVSQYLEVIGNPDLPPYWSLGFHLCRFGYKNLSDLQSVISRNRQQKLPLDTVWVDIDYMEGHNNFVITKEFKGIKEYVDELHKEGLHFVPIIDPGVASREGANYLPYSEGVEMKIFVKNSSGLPLEAKVWNRNGGTVFPDFSNPNTVDYWKNQFQRLYAQIEFDGAWIDMNEPSNFLNGSWTGCPANSSLENPPYTPKVLGGVLNYKTLCMEGKHYGGSHYNLHNLYGTMETIATNFALKEIRAKRSFIISRSTSSGQGKFGGHWTGDVFSTYEDMQHSVGDIMSFNMFGIPMVGPDICGFNDNTTPDLCQRWLELGAFYPFSRNHNSDDTIAQDPAVFDEDIINSTREAFLIRYSLLPYLYSLFYRSYLYGETVARPLFFEYPQDVNTYAINTQFMWGSGLLISPALKKDQDYTNTYLPKGYWYDYHNHKQINSTGNRYVINATRDVIPLFIRGGAILPSQIPDVTTTQSRQNPMYLLVALNVIGEASGFFYWDDGDSLNSWQNKKVSVIEFCTLKGTLQSTVQLSGYKEDNVKLASVTLLGVSSKVSSVTVNHQSHTKFNQTQLDLNIFDLNLELVQNFTISWS